MSLLTKTQLTKGSANVKARAVNAGRQAGEQARQARQQAMKARDQALKARDQARQQASQARQQAMKAASRAAPYAANAKVSASRGLLSARSWAAPRLEQSAEALQERIAPRMSAMLTAAARRIEPPRSRRPRWPFVVAGLVTLGAAAGVAVVKRRGSGMPWQQSQQPEEQTPAAQQAETANGQSAESSRVSSH